jgi:proteasome lid subunit RPN8/RPN11
VRAAELERETDSEHLNPIVFVLEDVIRLTGRLLRQSRRGRQRHEGIVYWAGRDTGTDVIITTCIAPRAVTDRGSFRVSAEANARAVMAMNDLHLVLLAQIHSHPGVLVDHSKGDNAGAFMPFEKYLSIIVPDYAREDPWPLTKCGVHRFVRGDFQRLANNEVEDKFRLLPTSCDLR